MIFKKQLIMTIGMTYNRFELTREMIENSIDTFAYKPIVLNKKAKLKDYRNLTIEDYINKTHVIGCILKTPNIIIEDNNVYADIYIFDEDVKSWNGKFDNWSIILNNDRFELNGIEVF